MNYNNQQEAIEAIKKGKLSFQHNIEITKLQDACRMVSTINPSPVGQYQYYRILSNRWHGERSPSMDTIKVSDFLRLPPTSPQLNGEAVTQTLSQEEMIKVIRDGKAQISYDGSRADFETAYNLVCPSDPFAAWSDVSGSHFYIYSVNGFWQYSFTGVLGLKTITVSEILAAPKSSNHPQQLPERVKIIKVNNDIVSCWYWSRVGEEFVVVDKKHKDYLPVTNMLAVGDGYLE